MNMLELISKVKDFSINYEIPMHELVVSHGGAAVLLGLREETNDVDITVPRHVFERFTARGKKIISTKYGSDLIQVTEDIDIHVYHNDEEYNPDELLTTNGVFFTNMRRTYNDYCVMNRQKDQVILSKLRSLLTEI